MKMKLCIICKKELDGSKKKYCSKKCNDRANYLKNKQKYIENARRWERRNPERKEEIKKKGFEKFYNEKRDRFNELMRNQYKKHKIRWYCRTRDLNNKLEIFEFFDGKCIRCNSKSNLQIHHKKYVKEFSFNDIELLCFDCHLKIHNK